MIMESVSQMQAKTVEDITQFISLGKSKLQRQCAHGDHTATQSEHKFNSKLEMSLQSVAIGHKPMLTALPIVQEVPRSPGRPLNIATRAFFEPRFGHDFSNVQVHTDAMANATARAFNARAYTVGDAIVFGSNQYKPHSPKGLRLLAHELAHVVQQSRGGDGLEAESRAEATAARVAAGQSVTPQHIGGAAFGLHAQTKDEEETRRPPVTSQTFSLDWGMLADPGKFQLTPLLGVPTLRPPWLTPSLISPPTSESEPELPSRLPLITSGQFSFGLRLGFPEVEPREVPGMPASALAESLRRAEILKQTVTGQIPTGWEAVDKGKLTRAVWSIFSTHIAPDLARGITSSLSTPTTSGASYQLDLVLMTEFNGAGLSFTIQY